MKEVDYIIVGQGIAGSAVALQLLKRNRRILVIDQPENNSSSRIAAGLFNPVTGRKMVRTWIANEIFPALHDFYRDAERLTQAEFFFPQPLYRPFLSIEEQNEWMAKSADPVYQPYVSAVRASHSVHQVHDEFGGLVVRQCGFLHTTNYIAAVAALLKKNDALLSETFDHQQLEVVDGVVYKNYRSARIIFCQGIHHNPWFNWLPLKPLKGETITIKSDFKETIIVNRGVYMLPFQNSGLQRVGATYNTQDKSEGVTDEARTELVEKLKELVTFDFEIVDQQWGWRPTTPDRRPFLGVHPLHRSLYVFNGLGTKGVSLAPYFSEKLIHWIEKGEPLNKEVDIERYKSVYWKSPE